MYDTLANDYDRFVNWENRLAVEIPFIERFITQKISETGKPLKVLDAACGTGMHALALSKLGFDVVGADFSSEMVAKARSNVLKTGLKTRFEPIGFGALASSLGEGQFDTVLCLGNSLPHLLSSTELQETLDDFAACLCPGGSLLIQNRNFNAVMAKKDRWMEPQVYQDGQDEWIFERFYDFEPNGLIQFNIVTLKRTTGSNWESSVTSTHLKPQLKDELEKALITAKFHNIQSYGSLTGEQFLTLASGNLVLTANKL
jgi:glycine/sarcosine N-methyltransferase